MRRLVVLSQFALLFAGCNTTWKSSQTEHALYSVVDTAQDKAVGTMISPYRDSMGKEMNDVVAVAAMDLPKVQPESLLGNLVAEIIFRVAEQHSGLAPDFSVQNYGGLRIPMLAKGEVTRGRVFELMPFENYVVIIHLEGGTVLQLIEHMATKGGWPVFGLRYVIVDGKPQDIQIGGNTFQSRQMYSVALPDYLANGGDDCDFLKDKPREESGVLIREAILTHMIELKGRDEQVTARTDGRVRYAE